MRAFGPKLTITAATVLGLGSGSVALAVSQRPGSLPANCASPGSSVVCTFSFTGAEQTFSVPAAVGSLQVTATGAAGGSPRDRLHAGNIPGGPGAVVAGTVVVSPGSTLYVEVGGAGGPDGHGGFNGGSAADPISAGGNGAACPSAGGGRGGQGATDSLPGAGGVTDERGGSGKTGIYGTGGGGFGGGGGGGLAELRLGGGGFGGGGGGSSLVPPGGTVGPATAAASVVTNYAPGP